MKKANIPIRLTGANLGPVGTTWEYRKTEREHVQRLFIFLEDRRVLFGPRHLEDVEYCKRSIIEIRGFLTELLMEAKPRRMFANALRAMRASCRKFLDSVPLERSFYPEFLLALGGLREMFGILLARLAYEYDLEVEGDLASIFPIEDGGDR
jgi:hypothetical protein